MHYDLHERGGNGAALRRSRRASRCAPGPNVAGFPARTFRERTMARRFVPLLLLTALGGISAHGDDLSPELRAGSAGSRLLATPITDFDHPWAMTFLPDGRLLVTEKPGQLLVVTQTGGKIAVRGVPEVAYADQGGLGDVILHPQFERN